MIYDWNGLEYLKRASASGSHKKQVWAERLAQRVPGGIGKVRELIG